MTLAAFFCDKLSHSVSRCLIMYHKDVFIRKVISFLHYLLRQTALWIFYLIRRAELFFEILRRLYCRR